ncbi:MAG: hypothetical protein QXR62_02770 [Candidatus Bathyarchaeia archaeon]|nr:hypothetical protein [Candidatus Bathyarchaeota archaeon]
MGFSAVVASAITLTGLLIFAGLTVIIIPLTTSAMTSLSQTIRNYNSMDGGARIELSVNSVDGVSVRFYLRNLGPKTIFFRRGNYDWNTILVSYRSDFWRTYLLDNYTILEKRIINSNYTLNAEGSLSLNPGEEALIEAYLPPEAPEIPVNDTVTVVFVSHYGSVAVGRGVRL